MRFNVRALRMMLETADAIGIPRARLFDGEDPSSAPHGEWSTLVAMLERLSHELGDDPERLREFGARMTRSPSNEFLQRLARQLVPLRAIYEAGTRWMAPAMFPHVPQEVSFIGGDRARLRASISASTIGSRPFFYIFEGAVREVPCSLGMPRATIISSDVGTHHADCLLQLAPQPSVLERARRLVHARLHRRDIRATFEDQHREIERGMSELLRATTELRDLLDRLPDLVAIHRDGTILWANHALWTSLGCESLEELAGKPLASIVHESSLAMLAERLQRAPDAQGLPALIEALLVRRDGEPIAVEVAPAQAVTYSGLPARLVVARDVTERVRMQERLVTADRLASLGVLAAGVAHEINNPLAYAMASVEVAVRDLGGGGQGDAAASARVRESLDTALHGLARVRTIVRDLRHLARPDDTRLAAVDVHVVAESTLSLAASDIERRARIVRDYEPSPPVLANEARLAQVILNLVVNALDAMAEGHPEQNELRVRIAPADAHVCIEVSDTGAGVPPEIAKRIFDPFFTTKPIGRGIGLGLSICHRIVTDLGGTIDVRSTPGRGSTFRVLLPRPDVPCDGPREGAST